VNTFVKIQGKYKAHIPYDDTGYTDRHTLDWAIAVEYLIAYTFKGKYFEFVWRSVTRIDIRVIYDRRLMLGARPVKTKNSEAICISYVVHCALYPNPIS